MNTINEAVKEFIGLFVDDGSLAIASIIWVLIMAFACAHITAIAEWRAPIFALGVAVILVENVVRSARK